MAYSKTNYVDGVTPLNAKNFNNNESALDQVVKDVTSISQALVQVDDKVEGKADVGHSHSELHSHSNKSVLDGVTSAKVTEWNNKSNFSGNYNDLTNKPTIPTVDVNKSYVDTELAKKSNTGHEHSEYTTETRVSNMIAEAQLGGGEVDLSGYATKDDLKTKSDVGHGHSYNDLTNKPTIPSITGLATTTYVDTGLSKKSDTHTHPYKSDAYVPTWSEITGKPAIPTVDVNKAYVDGELVKKSNTGHRHDASEIDNLPSGGSSVTVEDSLTSISATNALSAAQGKVLDNKISTLDSKSVKAKDYNGGIDVSIEPNVVGRLNDVELELEAKANLNSIFTMANMGQDVKEAMTGGSVAVVGKDAVLSENIVKEQVRYEHTNFLTYYENILNPTPKSTGTFWWYVDGVLTEKVSANFNCHNRVLLRKGVTYFIGDVYGLACIVTKLDGNTKITSLSSTDGVFAGNYTPTEDCYLYLTLYKITDATKSVVQNSTTKYPLGDMVYLYYGNKYNVTVEGINITTLKNDVNQIKSDLYKTGNTITVKKDGTGNFTNIVSAIKSITNSSYTNQYNIYLYDDEPNIYQFMDSTTLDSKGVWLPDGVNIIGVNGKRKIHCELPDSETDFRLQNVSTINMKYNNNLENLIITGKNVRYPVHDESSNSIKDWKRNVKNCVFEHQGSPSGKWSSLTAWGEGCSSGSESVFENCIFSTNSVTGAYGCHNNTNFTKPSKHKFINCRFLNRNPSGYSFKLGSMGSTQTDEVEFINCRFTGKIYSGEELSNGCGLDFKIFGSGNDNVFCDFVSSLSKNKTVDFIGETITCLNNTGTTITKGTLVKTASYLSIMPMSSSDSIGLFYGVAIEDIASGSFGLIKQKGYIEKGSLTANDGDKIGISNGSLAVVTSGDYIGKVVRGFIRLI